MEKSLRTRQNGAGVDDKMNKKEDRAFSLSMIAGSLILLNAVLLGIVTTWFPWVIPTLPGSAGNSEVPFLTLTSVGLICSVIVLLGALLLRNKPANKKAWGTIIIVFSIPTVIMGGGFIVGFILGIIGGAKALKWKPKT